MDVLVYDDDERRTALLQGTFSQENYRVVILRSGDALIDYLEDQRPDLIISNFELPKGGYELVNAILTRAQEPFPYVLFLTDEKNEKYVVDCLGPIPGDFISLPLRIEALQSRLAVAESTISLRAYLHSQEVASHEISMYDPETNLLNKKAIYERGLVEISRSHRENHTMGVAMIELINMEAIVKEYGEELFQLAIRFIANTIRANIRLYDVVGRWGKAQFLMLVPGLPREYAERMVRRLYDRVEEIKIRMMDDTTLKMSFVAGYTCVSSQDEASFAEIIEQAENALINVRKGEEMAEVLVFSEVI